MYVYSCLLIALMLCPSIARILVSESVCSSSECFSSLLVLERGMLGSSSIFLISTVREMVGYLWYGSKSFSEKMFAIKSFTEKMFAIKLVMNLLNYRIAWRCLFP